MTIDERLLKKSTQNGCQELHELCTKDNIFFFSKVPVHQTRACKFLEDFGFRIVDTNIGLETEGQLSIVPRREAYEVRFASDTDRDQVVDIARHGFQYTRFHLDQEIPTTLANEVKAQWAANYFLGKRGDYLVVASRGTKVMGFLQLIMQTGGLLVIDLIVVAKEYRGLGAASGMIAFAARECTDARRLRVGTQAANLASIRFYEKLGFRTVSAAYVFHLHGAASG